MLRTKSLFGRSDESRPECVHVHFDHRHPCLACEMELKFEHVDGECGRMGVGVGAAKKEERRKDVRKGYVGIGWTARRKGTKEDKRGGKDSCRLVSVRGMFMLVHVMSE